MTYATSCFMKFSKAAFLAGSFLCFSITCFGLFALPNSFIYDLLSLLSVFLRIFSALSISFLFEYFLTISCSALLNPSLSPANFYFNASDSSLISASLVFRISLFIIRFFYMLLRFASAFSRFSSSTKYSSPTFFRPFLCVPSFFWKQVAVVTNIAPSELSNSFGS